MTKARFDMQQPNVKVVSTANYDYVFICLNGTKKEEDTEYGSLSYFEYDYNEIIEKVGVLDIKDVKEHPENYLNYTKEKEQTNEEKIASLEAKNSELSSTIDSILTVILPSIIGA